MDAARGLHVEGVITDFSSPDSRESCIERSWGSIQAVAEMGGCYGLLYIGALREHLMKDPRPLVLPKCPILHVWLVASLHVSGGTGIAARPRT